ncbi:MAG: SRPBCC family protein [Halochromatium sp.]|uniref:SRPBCC family protein n=1 Tax=Halochromatium sp. TaxID=2049430 RepID=UPI00397B8E68
MPSFTVQETLHHPRPAVYDLVADIERYPEFVPGWKEARILWEEDNRRSVEQAVGVRGFVWRLRTEAVLERPHLIRIDGKGGPVRRLHQVWRFEEREPNVTLVELRTDYALAGGPMAAAAGPFFQRRTKDIVAAFRQRADALLGT